MFVYLRLKEERERLSLSQNQMAAIAGVTGRSQQNYESGKRAPDSNYLAALSQAGVDVLYIITGERMINNPRVQALSTAYGNADPAIQAAVCKLLDVDLDGLDNAPIEEHSGDSTFNNVMLGGYIGQQAAKIQNIISSHDLDKKKL